MGAVVNVITKEPRRKYEVTASLRYGTPYQRNGGDSLAGNASARDSREYRNKLDLPNLNADMTFGVNLGKFRSLTAVAYRTSDAYRLVGTRDEVRHYRELNIMRPKMNGPRPEMDPSTGMPVFVVGRTVADTTISVGPDSRGLSVSGWHDLNLSQRFDYELSDQFRFQLSGSYFGKKRFDFNGSILDENPLANNSKPWTYESYSGYNVKALMVHSPDERNKIYLSYVRDEYFRDLDSLSGVTVPKQRHTYNVPRLLWTLDAGSANRLTTGVEWVNEQLRFDMNPSGYDDRKSMNTGFALRTGRDSERSAAQFRRRREGRLQQSFRLERNSEALGQVRLSRFLASGQLRQRLQDSLAQGDVHGFHRSDSGSDLRHPGQRPAAQREQPLRFADGRVQPQRTEPVGYGLQQLFPQQDRRARAHGRDDDRPAVREYPAQRVAAVSS